MDPISTPPVPLAVAIQNLLDGLIAAGLVELEGVSEDGTQTYRLTAMAKALRAQRDREAPESATSSRSWWKP